jgi:hypothetical protein
MGEGCPLHWFDADLGAFDDLERRVAEHPADFFAGQDFDPVGACATRGRPSPRSRYRKIRPRRSNTRIICSTMCSGM